MTAFQIFVDTGLNGAAVAFDHKGPVGFHRFRKKATGLGVELEDFAAFCHAYRSSKNPSSLYIEEPALVPRGANVLSAQYYNMGQISATAQLSLGGVEPVFIQAISWIAWVKRELGPEFKKQESKDRSRAFAIKHFPEFIAEHFWGKNAPDGVTDCLGMERYLVHEQARFLNRL